MWFGIIIALLPKLLLQHINIKRCTSNYNATQHTSESRKSAEMAQLHDKCDSSFAPWKSSMFLQKKPCGLHSSSRYIWANSFFVSKSFLLRYSKPSLIRSELIYMLDNLDRQKWKSLFTNEYKLNRHMEFRNADESLCADGGAQAEHTLHCCQVFLLFSTTVHSKADRSYCL